jgi:hypothetical protein
VIMRQKDTVPEALLLLFIGLSVKCGRRVFGFTKKMMLNHEFQEHRCFLISVINHSFYCDGIDMPSFDTSIEGLR